MNEWDPLKKILVGRADNAKIPNMDISLQVVNYSLKDASTIQKGLYPKIVIDEANEDLEIFCEFLRKEGVEVERPAITNCGYYNYCPRDSVIIANKHIAAPMPIRARKDEWKAFEHCLTDVIDLNYHFEDNLYNADCIGNRSIRGLTERYPAFDAANVIRANDKILYLVSNSGNKAGAHLLQAIVDDIEVHILGDIYSFTETDFIHIHSTVTFLREGLMLLNPERIQDIEQLPAPFRNWDVIWCPEPNPIPYYGKYRNSSHWINMNLLSVNPNLVVLQQNQENLRKKLESHGIECAMLPLRHAVTLGGCFHSVTLDLERNIL